MREEHVTTSPLDFVYRITPACAGRTNLNTPCHIAAEDHPRVCGKNSVPLPAVPPASGSPPRVREELRPQRVQGQLGRITPACAGRTLARTGNRHLSKDHPRVCGKNPHCVSNIFVPPGSPPRVREEPGRMLIIKRASGITPACAGRTVKKSPFYAFSFSRRFINPFTFVASSLKISTFVLLRCSVLSPIPYALHTFFKL